MENITNQYLDNSLFKTISVSVRNRQLTNGISPLIITDTNPTYYFTLTYNNFLLLNKKLYDVFYFATKFFKINSITINYSEISIFSNYKDHEVIISAYNINIPLYEDLFDK